MTRERVSSQNVIAERGQNLTGSKC